MHAKKFPVLTIHTMWLKQLCLIQKKRKKKKTHSDKNHVLGVFNMFLGPFADDEGHK